MLISRELTLLDYGVKPAILTSQKAYNIILNKFGRSYFIMKMRSTNMVLLFKNVQLRDKCEQNGYLDWFSLGLVLGYPPLACSDFVEMARSEQSASRKRKIDYHGISFVCKEESIDECIQWLEIHRPVPENVQTGIRIFLPENRKRSVIYEDKKQAGPEQVSNNYN